MTTIVVTKPVDLVELGAQMTAAGVLHRGLLLADSRLFTPALDGTHDELPQAAVAVYQAHVPTPPITNYSGAAAIAARKRSTNAKPTELYRATLASLTGYRASLTLIAVDAGNGAVRTIEARVTAKRLNAGAVLVGSPVVVSDQQDSGTATWGIAASVSGNDFIITVTGAAGRNIDWLLDGQVVSFTPGGR